MGQLHTLIIPAEHALASGVEKKRMALHKLMDLAHFHGLDPPVLLMEYGD